MILALDYELRTAGIGGNSHGGVWIVGNFQNRQRLLRDLVVGSGQGCRGISTRALLHAALKRLLRK
jgi:hypothetical protein